MRLLFFALVLVSATNSAVWSATPQLSGVTVEVDVEYARRGDRRLRLDLYRSKPKPEKPMPVVVWVHGGGWNKGSKDKCQAVWLAQEAGYAVASVEYRLSTEARWPAQMDDCRDAVRWLRAHAAELDLDADHIGVWGSSAGGHLVALMGTLPLPENETVSARVQAVCDWYGPGDLLTMPSNVLSEQRTEADLAHSNGAILLGGAVKNLPDVARGASALYQVSSDDAPFLIMHGDKDTVVPMDQSQRLHEALKAAGVPSALEVVAGGGHGGPQFRTPEVQSRVRKFFDLHLRP